MGYADKISQIIDEVTKAIIGKRECAEMVLCAILAKGHVLIEDIPGIGKTTLALAFASAMDLDHNRIQFTPDILPSDVTGFTMYMREQEKFVYQPGVVMCNLLLADEINRTSSKTQSALLEAMGENSVTVDGVTRKLPEPFIVIATENPIGYTGTQMLPESQLDRFDVCIYMGYPAHADEIEILKRHNVCRPLDLVRTIISRSELLRMQEEVREVRMHDRVYEYIVSLAEATRKHPSIEIGLSPRGTLTLAAMTKARAYMLGRDYALPDDVVSVFADVSRHRIILSSESGMNHQRIEDVLRDVMKKVQKPVPERMHIRG